MSLPRVDRAKPRSPYSLTLLAAGGLLLAGALAAAAQGGFPERRDPYVNDDAGRLSTAERAELRSLLERARRETGVEAVAVVIDSVAGYPTGATTVENFATRLFNAWGLGDSVRNDGVLFLLAAGDRKVRIELGSGWGREHDAGMKRVIDQVMVPHLRAGAYGEGLVAGARAALETLGHAPPRSAAEAPANARPTPPRAASRAVEAPREAPPVTRRGDVRSGRAAAGNSFDFGRAALIGFVVAALGFVIYTVIPRTRRCPECDSELGRLSEKLEDVHLESGQKVEEFLDSVDYEIWECPGCDFRTTVARARWLSSFQRCPGCEYRTLSVTRRTVARPTYDSTGREEIDSACRHCDFHDTETVILPKRVRLEDDDFGGSRSGNSSRRSSSGIVSGGRSSSGGGGRSSSGGGGRSSSGGRSSGGGGRSSGGGASGSW